MPTVGLLGTIAAVHISIGSRQRFAGFSSTPSIKTHCVTMVVYPKSGWVGGLSVTFG